FLRYAEGGEAERPPPEAVPWMPRRDDPAALAPVRPHHRRPPAGVEGADRAPTGHGDRVGLVEQVLDVVRRDGEAEVLGDAVTQGDDAEDFALEVDDGAAAVPLLDGHGELEH